MAIYLPAEPAHRDATPFQISFAEDQVPFKGGPEKRIFRLGSRMGLTVKLPPMKYVTAMEWIASLLPAEADEVIFRFRQSDFVNDVVGSVYPQYVRVNGALNPNTTTVNVKDKASGTFKKGQAISIQRIATGRWYLHFITDATNQAALKVWPPLRAGFANNDIVATALPVIQGQLTDAASWDLDRALSVGLSFQVKETA